MALGYNERRPDIAAIMNCILEVGLFGGFRLVYDGRTLDSLSSPRLQSLIAYLIIHRDSPRSRRQLAFLLWPDSSEDQARTNIRKMILALRRALPEPDVFLRDDHGALQWKPDAPFRLDVADFERAAAAGDFERAVSLYSGDLLPDCYEEWTVDIRERLRRTYLDALERVIRRKEDLRDYASALSFAHQLRRCDPLREEIHRHIMRLYALSGDRASALRAYEECADLLQKELGVAPSPATRQAYENILRSGTDGPQIIPLANTFPLIGRDAEWSQLQEVWRTASAGNPRFALILGEAGIGKTRLAEELLVWAERQSVSVAGTACYAAEGASAYSPVATWLRGRSWERLAPQWRAEIARLLPAADGDPAVESKPGPLTENWQLQRFHEALARAVLGSDLAAGQPVLLFLDDIQWCDGDTLAWLNYVLRINPRARLMLLATARAEAMPEDGPLPVLLADLRRQKALTEITVHGLDPADTVRLGETASGRPLDAQAATDLFRETEGNPLFIVEYARAGLAHKPAPQGTGSAALPPLVQAAVVSHLTHLSAEALEIVRLGAVIGREFSFDVLRRALKQDEEKIIEALDELRRRGVIREQGSDAYGFSHDKLRQVAYDRLSALRRCVLHKRIAEALAGVHARRLGPVAGQIGWHYEQAGETQAAVDWLWRAGDYSATIGAYVQAVTNLKHALGLLAEDDPRRAELLCRVGSESAIPFGGEQEMEYLRKGLELAERTGNRDGMGKASLCMSHAIANRGRNLEATRLAQAAMEHAEAAGDRETKAGALFSLGSLAYYRQEHGQSLRYLEESLSIFQDLQAAGTKDYSHSIGRVMNTTGLTFMDMHEFDKAARQWQETFEWAGRHGDHPVQSMVTTNLGYMAFIRGEYDEADRFQMEALRMYAEDGNHGGLAVAYNNLGHVALHRRDFAKSEDYFRSGLREGAYYYATPMVLDTLAGLAGLWAQTGDPVRAAELFGRAVAEPVKNLDVEQIAPFTRRLLEERLTPEELDAALQRGSRMDIDQLIKDVMRDLSPGEVPLRDENRAGN